MTTFWLVMIFVFALGSAISFFMYNYHKDNSSVEKHKEVLGKQEQLGDKIDSSTVDLKKTIEKKSKPTKTTVIKNETKNTVNAPNALIVTQNQSGGQNTVNNYVAEIEKPRITFISEKTWPEKLIPPTPLFSGKDLLYKTSIYFQYYSEMPKNELAVAILKKDFEVEFVDIHYPGISTIMLSKEPAEGNFVKGMKLFDPKNGKLEIAIYTKNYPKNLKNNAFVKVDSLEYSLK